MRPNPLERALLVLKPDGTIRRYVGARVLKEVTRAGLKVVAFAEVRATREFLEERHYAVHKGKFFFPWLVEYVSCSPVVATVVEGEDCIRRVRDLLGPTLPEKATAQAPASIRARYGIAGGINVAHASDAPETAATEVKMWTEEFGFQFDGKAGPRCAKYVEEYVDFPIVDSVRYREICEAVTADPQDGRRVEAKLSSQLDKETDKAGRKFTSNLSKVIVKNFLIREG
jgi:nucleoside-diphosphate kinase